MAGKTGRQIPNIKKRLLDKGSDFSFIQAYRLLKYSILQEEGTALDESEIDKRIFVHPQLSLTYPESDVNKIDELSSNHFLMEVTFLGLYSSSSPLPTFYTEDLLYEQSEDKSVSRDFLDIINFPLYQTFFKSWSKYRLFYSIIEHANLDTLQRLYCLIGLEGEKIREKIESPFSLLRYIGLLTHFPKSAESLKSLLSDALDEPTIKIIQCIPRIAKLPEDQRFTLGISGNSLGNDSFIGTETIDRMCKFRVQAGPFGSDAFHRLLPDKSFFHKMKQLINFYIDQSFIWDFKIFLKGDSIQTTILGNNKWSHLGWNTWLFSTKFQMKDESVILYPQT
jgi:type VI secretion system protein ImpH